MISGSQQSEIRNRNNNGSFVLRHLSHVYVIQGHAASDFGKYLGTVVRKPINANPRLKINQGVYFSTPKCCTTLIFSKILHYTRSSLKTKNNKKKLSPKS